ncbi:SDH family Clp fold serine proteinase [Thermus tenuipuniceus]|uniref:SDH family Clp fold serine proteinase n=1 Tax=Thermus tenuipuniceus TaxID=2078690 RepID=UPI000CF991C7|nr:ATP-dependent Clp protease proteolytic subunit [Thermus tenuipuniceus]
MDVGTLVNSLFWLFLIFAFLSPYLQRQALEAARTRQILSLERKRGSRVITLIHRQEAISLLGVPLVRYIDVDDSEEVLRAIRLTDPQMPIDLILHTPGGLVLAAEQIALALLRHPAKVTVFVPHYAMSGGTLIALAADEIVMDENAVLGPIDPQIGDAPAASLLALLQTKPIEKIEDATLIKADIAAKAMKQVAEVAEKLLAKHMDPEKARTTARLLSQGTWTHDYPITVEEARGLGLPVSTDMPREVYALMELYPQTQIRRPSVQYIPLPYTKGGRE